MTDQDNQAARERMVSEIRTAVYDRNAHQGLLPAYRHVSDYDATTLLKHIESQQATIEELRDFIEFVAAQDEVEIEVYSYELNGEPKDCRYIDLAKMARQTLAKIEGGK